MNDLVNFTKRVEKLLAGVKREPHWEPEKTERYMADVDVRRQRFEEIAVRINDTVIQPRLETLVSYFSNADLTSNEPVGHCACWFGYCERFPASTKVAFAFGHDVRFEKVSVCFEASMMPAFIKFNEHDRLTSAIDETNDDSIADWVEERLVEFLDTYLRIDRGSEEFDDETAIDPVCGMRISRSSVEAGEEYRGHSYYFCSTDCQEKFVRKPTAYVQVKTM